MRLDPEEFRDRLKGLARETGRSYRQLSAAFGRDPGYVQALLDPKRFNRARPTPDDLLRASQALGIPFADLLERLWGVSWADLGDGGAPDPLRGLTGAERDEVLAYVQFLVQRRRERDRSSR